MASYKSIAYDQVLANASAMVLLQEQTASSSATISFTKGIDSTYKEYIFAYVNAHPATDNVFLSFNGSDDASSHSYDIAKQTSFFRAYNNEGDSATILGEATGSDLALGTGFQYLEDGNSNDNDHASAGFLHLFSPSNTTFVKHFIAKTASTSAGDFALSNFIAGYFNTTAAITAIQFKFSSGNIDVGTFKLYGVK